MNAPPGNRFRVGQTALTMAEYFRDDEHRDVLLLIDNIFRFIQAGMQVSGLMGQMPSQLGYQPTMSSELSGLEARIADTRAGAITSGLRGLVTPRELIWGASGVSRRRRAGVGAPRGPGQSPRSLAKRNPILPKRRGLAPGPIVAADATRRSRSAVRS